jgi:hypothetical protein
MISCPVSGQVKSAANVVILQRTRGSSEAQLITWFFSLIACGFDIII